MVVLASRSGHRMGWVVPLGFAAIQLMEDSYTLFYILIMASTSDHYTGRVKPHWFALKTYVLLTLNRIILEAVTKGLWCTGYT